MPEATVTFEADGNIVRLVQETPARFPFRKASCTIISPAQWAQAPLPQETTVLVGRLLQALQDGEAGSDGRPLVSEQAEAVQLHPDFMSRLNEAETRLLGLPPQTPLLLYLSARGVIHKDGFRIDTTWKRNSIPVSVRLHGGFLYHDGQNWQIPAHLRNVLNQVDAVNAANDEASRYEAIGRLKIAIANDLSAQVRTDGILQRLRIAYASGFSLSLEIVAGGLQLTPVLFSRAQMMRAAAGGTLDEEADSLLPSTLTKGFRRRFLAGNGTRRTYLLDDGALLYIDPDLAQALGKVREAMAGARAQGLSFARSPRRYIAPPDRERSRPADELFAETLQFSAHMAQVEAWQQAVLPWIRQSTAGNPPDAFGLRIGDPPKARIITLDPADVVPALDAARAAITGDHTVFTIGQSTGIPATRAAVSALESLRTLVAFAAEAGDANHILSEQLARHTFLHIADNGSDTVLAPLDIAPPAKPLVPASIPDALLTLPLPHQAEGFDWLTRAWASGMQGGVLASDGGQGKTWQALAFLAWLRRNDLDAAPMLAIMPPDQCTHWQSEIKRHLAPDSLGPVIEAFGAKTSGSSPVSPSDWTNAGLVLTDYDALRDYSRDFAQQPFSVLVFDDLSRLRKTDSSLNRAARSLDARFRIGLCDTPIEHGPAAFSSMIEVVQPDAPTLGTATAQTPVTEVALAAWLSHLADPADGVAPVLFQQTKVACSANLPAVHTVTLPEIMPADQARAYWCLAARAQALVETGDHDRMRDMLRALRRVSLASPDQGTAGPLSARLAATIKACEQISQKSEKVIIFCDDHDTQSRIAAAIRQHLQLPHPVECLHDDMPLADRHDAAARFQKRKAGFDVLVLSPATDLSAMDLTAANHVFHFSRGWNPALEDRAIACVHRIGQSRDVTVYLPQSVHPDEAIRPFSLDLVLHRFMERERARPHAWLGAENTDQDILTLFNEVIGALPDLPPPAPVSPPPVAPPASRPRLGIRKPPPAAPAPAIRAPLHDRVVFAQGGPRDMAIFTKPLAQDPIRTLRIIDPYAAAGDRARQNTVRFAQRLLGEGRGGQSVLLVTFDTQDVSTYHAETSNDQYDDMHQRWARAFNGKVDLEYVQVARNGNRDLHDREVRATTQSGRHFIWDVGRGIDGVMKNNHRCVVVLTEGIAP